MKTLEIDGIKVRVQIWWVTLLLLTYFCSFLLFVYVHFVLCAGTRLVRSVTRPLPNSTTGGRRWSLWILESLFMRACSICSVIRFVNSCSGYRLCLRHHKWAVLSAHSEVGQWCGWSRSISTLISLPRTCCPSQWPSICTTAYWTVACLLNTQWISVGDVMSLSRLFAFFC